MSKFSRNHWHARDLTLNVMERCASEIGADIHDDEIADRIYWSVVSLESFPEGEGFGSSDFWPYLESVEREFDLPEGGKL